MVRTLGDCIKAGKHELVAFVGDRNSKKIEIDIIKSHLGVLVLDRKYNNQENEGDQDVSFFYKKPAIYQGHSDIMQSNFGYSAKIVGEVPLSIVTTITSSDWLKEDSEEFHKARELLQGHGLY